MQTGRPGNLFRATAAAILAASLLSAIAVAQDSTPGVRERVLQYLERASYIEPGRGLGGVRIGMPLQSVIERWGPPLRGDRQGVFDRQTILLYKTGIDTWVRVVGDRSVEEIGIEGHSRLTTPEGVGFGTPRNQVSMIYGRAAMTETGEASYPERGIGFVFRGGTVFQIRVFEPGPAKGS